MKVYQHGKRFRITYQWRNKIYNESFQDEKAAQLRGKQIEFEIANGTFLPPENLVDPSKQLALTRKTMTVSHLMKLYVNQYGINKWSPSVLSDNRHRIAHYIVPYIGDMHICEITTHQLEEFYQRLLQERAVPMKGQQNQRTIGISVVAKVHSILRSALNQAIRWDFLQGVNPASTVELPKRRKTERAVWSVSDCKRALSVCTDPTLHLCMVLAIGCSMRIGEILGLTWDCVHIEPELISCGEAYLHVEKELIRCRKDSIAALQANGRDEIFFTFPEWKKTGCTTSLILKTPKTESSERTIYLPHAVVEELQRAKAKQNAFKADLGELYQNYNLVVAQENGRPVEENRIMDRMKALIAEHDLPPVVFHSLRHSSTCIKLRSSGGDIKAVQGDTGHAQANMVLDVYSHTMDADRKELARKMDEQFFSPQTEATAAASTDDPYVKQIIQLLQEHPEISEKTLSFASFLQSQQSS